MDRFMRITRALASTSRVRILLALGERELSALHITKILEISPPPVSRHMSRLVDARLIRARKDGRWCYYRLAGKDASLEVLEVTTDDLELKAASRDVH